MSSPTVPFEPFFLLTDRLIIVPTPIARAIPAWCTLYAHLNSLDIFCHMAFGPSWPIVEWDEAKTQASIENSIKKCWDFRGMGDMAVGLWVGDRIDIGRKLDGENEELKIVSGEEYEKLLQGGELWDEVEWLGYAGVRDATTYSLPAREEGDAPWPHWQEMVEMRYGVDPKVWGKGVAPEAAKAVMRWAVAERGVRRFIAATEKNNSRSGAVLGKMGYKASETNYFKEPRSNEWVREVSDVKL